MSRTIEQELRELAGTANLQEAVRVLGIVGQTATLRSIEVIQPWYRSGSETYLTRFTVSAEGEQVKDLVLKACTALTQNLSVEQTLNEWVRRRISIAGAGVGTPTLYGHGQGILVEEYVPLSLNEAARDPSDRQVLAQLAARTAAILVSIGYRPISLFADVRSRGRDVVVVDFGSDLGPDRLDAIEHDGVRSDLARFLSDIEFEDAKETLESFDRHITAWRQFAHNQ